MHGQTETSWVPRTTGVIVHVVLLLGAGWLCLGGGITTVGELMGRDWQTGNSARCLLLFLFGVVLWLRLTLTTFSLLQRRFDWGELIGVMLACGTYQIGFALLGATNTAPIDMFDVLAVGIFLLGSYLNTWSEIQRKRFKADPANRGRLYTGGLFRYARHINYFGDTLWVLGWAMLTRNPWSVIIPLVLAAGFVFYFIPALATHLKQKYGDQYDEWTTTTKCFVPFLW